MKKATTPENFTCESWISGKHSENIEINTRIPYVSIYDYFVQGDEAKNIIKEINYVYNTQECTPLQACEIWAKMYL
jgi:hypothetical protein